MARPLALAVVALFAFPALAHSFEAVAVREADGPNPPGAPIPCGLRPNLNGTCGNYHWYNVCSGYVWIYSGWEAGEAVGVRFGAPGDSCVGGYRCLGNVKRAIVYCRNVVPAYQQTIDVYLDRDANEDGCAEGIMMSALNVDPGLRWNCIDFGWGLVDYRQGVVVRQVHHGGYAPSFATDGPYSQTCDPIGVQRSFYYGVSGSACQPWQGPTGRHDNFLTWIVVDWYFPDEPRRYACCYPDGSCAVRSACECILEGGDPYGGWCPPNPCLTRTEERSWGNIKALFR